LADKVLKGSTRIERPCPVCSHVHHIKRKYTDVDKTKIICTIEASIEDKSNKGENNTSIKRKDDREVTAAEALSILSAYSDEELHLLGINPETSHPTWMIYQYLPFPPITMRPNIFTDDGKRKIDENQGDFENRNFNAIKLSHERGDDCQSHSTSSD
jgi:DNA-directed RNA polymerase beta' subunit